MTIYKYELICKKCGYRVRVGPGDVASHDCPNGGSFRDARVITAPTAPPPNMPAAKEEG